MADSVTAGRQAPVQSEPTLDVRRWLRGLPSRPRASFWLEWYTEMRRHAANEQLPPALRDRLRDSVKRAQAMSSAAMAPVALPRRRLREPWPLPYTAAQLAGAAAGIPRDRPVVAVEAGRRADMLAESLQWLRAHGYHIVPIGDRVGLAETAAVHSAQFVICEAIDVQLLACATGTPSLLLNARDPFTGYPVRRDSLFTLATAVDLDNGHLVAPDQQFDLAYLTSRRSFGARRNRSREVLAVVEEMHEGLSHGFADTPQQAAFRDRVTAAGEVLRGSVPLVAEWGPDGGFIGEGRLARWQAERIQ